jgi:hypothetical protein
MIAAPVVYGGPDRRWQRAASDCRPFFATVGWDKAALAAAGPPAVVSGQIATGSAGWLQDENFAEIFGKDD